MEQDLITRRLVELSDPVYKAFQSKLLPTVSSERVLGVRIPYLRSLAKILAGTQEADAFLQSLPHRYYDEDNLHAFLIEQIKDYTTCMEALETFLPFVDNWATCDSMSPCVFKKHLPELKVKIRQWLEDEHPYTVRYGMNMLMRHFMQDYFDSEDLQRIAELKRDEYYVRMAVAWYFATALTWQYEAALPYIENHRLSPWIHQKTIQKAVESYRIPDDRKNYLKTLRGK